jgi:hypothetical protein
MQTHDAAAISLDELANTLASYAGEARPRRLPVRRRRPWRITLAATALALVSVGAAYAAGLNPFAGISAANHPATPRDALPAPLAAHIAEFSSRMEQMGHGHVLADTARLIIQLPSGMRFYTVTTSAGGLCLVNVDPPGGNTQGGFQCGDSLIPSRPITLGSEQANTGIPPVSYGLAMDGVTAVSFGARGTKTTVPLIDGR